MSHGTVYTEELLDHVETVGQREPHWPPTPPPKYGAGDQTALRSPSQIVATLVEAIEDKDEPLWRRCNVCRRAYSGLRVMHGRGQCSARCARIARDGGPS